MRPELVMKPNVPIVIAGVLGISSLITASTEINPNAESYYLFDGSCLAGLSAGVHAYGQAPSKSINFFEAQSSVYLPGNHRVKWRGNSGLINVKVNGVHLVGGCYDAEDNM